MPAKLHPECEIGRCPVAVQTHTQRHYFNIPHKRFWLGLRVLITRELLDEWPHD